MGLRLVCRQTILDEVRHAACGRRIEIRKHNHGVARCGADGQFAVHSGCAAAVAEAGDSVGKRAVEEAVCVFPATWNIRFGGGEQLGVRGIEQFVIFERVRECEKVADG